MKRTKIDCDTTYYCPNCSCRITEIRQISRNKNKIHSPLSEEQYYCPYCGVKMSKE